MLSESGSMALDPRKSVRSYKWKVEKEPNWKKKSCANVHHCGRFSHQSSFSNVGVGHRKPAYVSYNEFAGFFICCSDIEFVFVVFIP